MKPMLDPAFWSDPDIEAAGPEVKLTALWLITNSQTSLLGVCAASFARFEFETKLKPEALSAALEALPRAFKRVGGVVFIRNYIRHQFGTGDKLTRNNFFVALKSLFHSVKDDELRAEILAEYPEFNEGLTKGLPRAYQAQVKEREGKDSKGQEGSPEGRIKKDKATAEEIAAYIAELKLPASDGEWFFEKCQGNGWTNNGKPIKDWQATIRSWRAAGYLPSQKQGANGHAHAPEKKSLFLTKQH